MVSVLQIRIIGTAMLVFSMLLFLYSLLTMNRQACATCFIALIIAVTLLYYARRIGDRPQ